MKKIELAEEKLRKRLTIPVINQNIEWFCFGGNWEPSIIMYLVILSGIKMPEERNLGFRRLS